MTTEKPYYNHDHLWERRHFQKKPVWGPHSEAAYHNILNRVLHLHPEATSLCDAGCGAGAMGDLAVKRGLKYAGMDESATAIRMGQEAFPHHELRQWDLVKSIPSECAGKFSIVMSINVLHCISDPTDRQSLLKNMLALAEPNGRLALSTMCLPKRENFRVADSPRVFFEAEQIMDEIVASGWSNLILREFIPADQISPVTNMLVIAARA